jgi:hypothetical protein
VHRASRDTDRQRSRRGRSPALRGSPKAGRTGSSAPTSRQDLSVWATH